MDTEKMPGQESDLDMVLIIKDDIVLFTAPQGQELVQKFGAYARKHKTLSDVQVSLDGFCTVENIGRKIDSGNDEDILIW
jgi:hypothetical protein